MFNRGPVGHLHYRIHQVMMKHKQFSCNEFRYNILAQYNELSYIGIGFLLSLAQKNASNTLYCIERISRFIAQYIMGVITNKVIF